MFVSPALRRQKQEESLVPVKVCLHKQCEWHLITKVSLCSLHGGTHTQRYDTQSTHTQRHTYRYIHTGTQEQYSCTHTGTHTDIDTQVHPHTQTNTHTQEGPSAGECGWEWFLPGSRQAPPATITFHRLWEETPGHFKDQVGKAAVSTGTVLRTDARVPTIPAS